MTSSIISNKNANSQQNVDVSQKQNGGNVNNQSQSKSSNLKSRDQHNNDLDTNSVSAVAAVNSPHYPHHQNNKNQTQANQNHPAYSTHTSKSDSVLLNKHNKKGIPQDGLNIPQFYFPLGRPQAGDGHVSLETTLQLIKEAFNGIEGGKATRQNMGSVAKVGSSSI